MKKKRKEGLYSLFFVKVLLILSPLFFQNILAFAGKKIFSCNGVDLQAGYQIQLVLEEQTKSTPNLTLYGTKNESSFSCPLKVSSFKNFPSRHGGPNFNMRVIIESCHFEDDEKLELGFITSNRMFLSIKKGNISLKPDSFYPPVECKVNHGSLDEFIRIFNNSKKY